MARMNARAADRLWESACQGAYLWPWQWRAFLAAVTTDRLLCLAGAVTTLPTAGGRYSAAQALRRVARANPQALRAAAGLIAPLLAALDPLHDSNALDSLDVHGRQIAVVAALEALGDSADGSLRELLAGPPRPTLFVNNGSGFDVPLGAKLVALDLLADRLTSADDVLLAGLVTDQDEPQPVRDQAALLWLRLVGSERSPMLAEYLLTRPSDFLRRRLKGTPPEALAALVPPLVAALHGSSPELRMRARGLLILVGQPASDALAHEVRTADTWQSRQNAEEALAAINPTALRAAIEQREADDRSLSLATPLTGDAERGLSPTAPREPRRPEGR